MSGRYGGIQALICKRAPHAMWTHCTIHREALAAKSLNTYTELNSFLEHVIDLVNYIETRPLKNINEWWRELFPQWHKYATSISLSQTLISLFINDFWSTVQKMMLKKLLKLNSFATLNQDSRLPIWLSFGYRSNMIKFHLQHLIYVKPDFQL